MAASDTEFPLFRKLPTANQSTTNFTARLGQHLLSFFASLVSLPVNLSGTRDYSTTQLAAKATQLYHTYPYVHLNHSQWYVLSSRNYECRANHFDRAAA